MIGAAVLDDILGIVILAVVVALFATVFFVLIGSGLDLAVLNPFDAANQEGLVMAGFLLVAAVISKVADGWSDLSQEPTASTQRSPHRGCWPASPRWLPP